MKEIQIKARLIIDDSMMYGSKKEGREWFYDTILKSTKLYLHENEEIGDTIGKVIIDKITEE